MAIAEDRAGRSLERDTLERITEGGTDVLLGAALGVAESVAQRHGGEIRLGTRDDGGRILVELRFPLPDHQA